MSEYTIKTMTRQEIDIAVDWAAAEGWNPGLGDADCFFAADAGGFLLGLLGTEPIATLSAVQYGATFGSLGFYIVKPAYRGKGYGLQIWKAGLARLEGRTIGLDGVVAQLANYKQSGFRLAHRNIRYQGRGGGSFSSDPSVISLSTLPLATVVAYDRPFFPDDRTAFLHCWLSQPGCPALGIWRGGRLAGYGVVRPCRSGYKLGPLFADDADLAERLFVAMCAQAPEDAPVFLDIPELNLAALALVQRHGMTPMFETARMYKGVAPTLPLDRMFGVSTFELG